MDFSNYKAQETLFAVRPSRLALQQLDKSSGDSRRIVANVWRNHAIEPIVALTWPYQAYGRYLVDYRFGDYDDALMFVGHQPADIELLWIDSSRYLERVSLEDWLVWLGQRVRSLRNISSSPVIVATWLQDAAQSERLRAALEEIPAVFFADIQAVCDEAGVTLLDPRTAAMAGTPVSNSAQPLLARKLACHWMPAAFLPPIKALALDLDNTLHAGVLGEDGIQGVQLTPAHQALQQFIKSLQQRGIFIALVSRNERADVEALFSERDDYPLQWSDFSAVEVSWGDKATALASIARTLRISPDAILFVDDNPGELASVTAQLHGIHAVYATPDAMQTQRAIEYHPGLWRWKVEADDAKRVKDMKANAERDELLKEAMDPADYFRSLQTKLVFRYDPVDQLGRLADLCNKTNQFNMAMRRFNQAELADRMAHADACVVSVQMSDRLSDSGVIAVIVAERQDERLMIEELCISCRAMGRQLEDALIMEALRGIPVLSGCTEVIFCARVGPRNQPAFTWLARMLDNDKLIENGFYPLPAGRLSDFAPPGGISLIKEQHGSHAS